MAAVAGSRAPDGQVLAEARAGDPVALARVLVGTPSVNPELESGGAGEADIAPLCAGLLEGWGLETRVDEVAPGRLNVVGRLAGRGPTLLLNGHLDTVGVEGMSGDPFGAEVRGGRLHGRGACDMKGGVAALMATAHRLAGSSHRPELVVALTADEEHASIGMAHLVSQGVEADLAVVCEPTSLAIMPAHKGFVWIRARFRGRAAHGSRPELGVDAIRHAALWMTRLEAHADALSRGSAHPLLGHGSFHAGTIRGGSAESVYPDLCELVLERRTLPGEETDAVLAPLREALEGLHADEPALDAELEVILERPGTAVPLDAPLVGGLRAALSERGLEPRILGMSAWVDAAYLNEAGIPAVCFGPGSIEQAHTADEWIDVAEIRACTDVLEAFARRLAD